MKLLTQNNNKQKSSGTNHINVQYLKENQNMGLAVEISHFLDKETFMF